MRRLVRYEGGDVSELPLGKSEIIAFTARDSWSVPYGVYPSGEPWIDTASLGGPPRLLLVRPSSMTAFVAALWYADALRERRGVQLDLFLPFVPGARQDRANAPGPGVDYLVTAKSVAHLINQYQFERVHIIAPHSDVAPALIDRCQVIPMRDVLPHFPSPHDLYTGVIAPDAGATKRATDAATYYGLPLYQAWKRRDPSGGAIHGYRTEPLPTAGHFLVVDDICDGGRTFLELHGTLQRANATADLYVAHGLFSNGTTTLLESYRHIYCTDSTVGPKDGIGVLAVCAALASAACIPLTFHERHAV